MKGAPSITLGGHSSHVLDVRFYGNGDKSAPLRLATVGGQDSSLMLWRLQRLEEPRRTTTMPSAEAVYEHFL